MPLCVTEQSDGTVLFVFGSQEEAEEAQDEEAQPEEQPAQPEHTTQSAPEQPPQAQQAAAEPQFSPAVAAAESQPEEPSPGSQASEEEGVVQLAEATSAAGNSDAAPLASFPFNDGASDNGAVRSFSRTELSDMKVRCLRHCHNDDISLHAAQALPC